VDQHRLDPERIGDEARVLSARAAETVEREPAHVVPPGDRDRADRLRHARHRDRDEALCGLLATHRLTGSFDFAEHFIHSALRNPPIERFIDVRTEHLGEEFGLQLAEDEVAVGHRQRPALAIARRSRLSPRALGPGEKTGTVEPADRPPASRHGMDAQHGRADPNPGDAVLAVALVST